MIRNVPFVKRQNMHLFICGEVRPFPDLAGHGRIHIPFTEGKQSISKDANSDAELFWIDAAN